MLTQTVLCIGLVKVCNGGICHVDYGNNQVPSKAAYAATHSQQSHKKCTMHTLQRCTTGDKLQSLPVPGRLCCPAGSSRCPTESWCPLPTSAVKSSLHRQHRLMLTASKLPKICTRQKGCSKSYICQCLGASLSACAHIKCLNGPGLPYKIETDAPAAAGSVFVYLELHLVMAFDLPLGF